MNPALRLLGRTAAWIAPASHTRELRPLDAVRGIAALLVFVFHLENPSHYAYFSDASVLGTSLRTLVRHGYLWVDMFLVLSGFILATKYHALRAGPDFSIRRYIDFIVKRFARVYPLYIFMTLTVIALHAGEVAVPWWPDRFDPPLGSVVPNLLLIQAWGLAPSLDAPAWSLSAEYAVYLAFPLVTTVLLTGGRATFAAGFGLVMALIVYLWWTTMGSESPYDVHDFYEFRTVLRAFAGFGLGVLAWRFQSTGVWASFSGRLRAVAAGGSVLLVLVTMARDGQEWAIIPSFAVLLVALSEGGILTQRILNAPILYTLGYLSFSVYLIHDQLHPVRRVLEQAGGPYLGQTPAHLLALVLTLGVGFGLAALAYHFVEEPARSAILRRWSTRKVQQLA